MFSALAAALLFVAATTPSAASRKAQWVAAGWLAAGVISSCIALVQYFGEAPHFSPWMNASAPGEAFGNLRQRNQFASLTAIGMAAAYWFAARSGRWWPLLAAMLVLGLANAASASRTGLVQMLMLLVFMAMWPGTHRRRRLAMGLAGCAAYLMGSLLLPPLLHQVTGVAAPTVWSRIASAQDCSSRTVLWSNVLHLIAQKPWFGWGPGELDYAHYIASYPGARFCDILDNAHNLPLHMAVELGVPAALLVCGACLWWTWKARPWSESDPGRQLAWSVLAVIALHSMLEYPLWYGPFQIAFGLCLALLWRGPAATSSGRQSPLGGHRIARRIARGGALVLLLACIGYAAWDYRRIGQVYLLPEERAAAYAADPLAMARSSWLFRNQMLFAELTLTPLTRANAQWTFETAAHLLHYSPEPRVIEKLIEAALQLGSDDQVAFHLQRFRAAFPAEHARWAALHGAPIKD